MLMTLVSWEKLEMIYISKKYSQTNFANLPPSLVSSIMCICHYFHTTEPIPSKKCKYIISDFPFPPKKNLKTPIVVVSGHENSPRVVETELPCGSRVSARRARGLIQVLHLGWLGWRTWKSAFPTVHGKKSADFHLG